MEKLISLFGIFVMLGICYALSTSRKDINWRTVISGVLLQIILCAFILKTSIGVAIFDSARVGVESIIGFTTAGSRFIFGDLTDSSKFGFIFFTMVLPTIIFVSSLMSVLYYLGIMQFVIKLFAKVMVKVMNVSGSESLASAANIFAGQTEAPLVVKPLIANMTRSELMALMVGGMATVAGGVLAAYVSFGIDAGHLLASSVISAPAALVCAKLLIPETQESETKGELKVHIENRATNVIDAAASGASEGLQLAMNVGAMLLAFVALIAMINGLFGLVGGLFGFPDLTVELIMGYLFAPLAFIIGVPMSEAVTVGALIGKKTVLNEFVAYLDLQSLMKEGALSDRAVILSTYALCGFSNFSSIAIQVGGISVLAPNRRKDLAELGLRALVGGTIVCMMTAAVAGLFI